MKTMTEMTKVISSELGIQENEIYCMKTAGEDGLTYVSFCSLWMWYELYLDEQGQILGLNMEPLTDRAELVEPAADYSCAA